MIYFKCLTHCELENGKVRHLEISPDEHEWKIRRRRIEVAGFLTFYSTFLNEQTTIIYFLLTEHEGHTRRILPESSWYGLCEARSVQERLTTIFSQYGPELVRVNKKFITSCT